MNTQSPANEAPRASVGHRLLGVLIMTKAALPLALVALLAFGVWQITSGVSRAVDDARSVIEPQLAVVQARIDDVQAEGRRLLDEVKKIENATTEVVGAVKQSVEPIRKSLLGLSGALKTVSATVASLLNAIIRALNGIPIVKDLPLVKLPNIEIPGITLPKLDLDVNLRPNLEAVHQLNEAAQQIALQAQQVVDRHRTAGEPQGPRQREEHRRTRHRHHPLLPTPATKQCRAAVILGGGLAPGIAKDQFRVMRSASGQSSANAPSTLRPHSMRKPMLKRWLTRAA